MTGVPGPQHVVFADLHEPLAPELPDGHQHLEARLVRRAVVRFDEVQIHQRGERVEQRRPVELSLPAPVWSASGNWSLLDQRTGIWATDTFGCILPGEPVSTVAELDGEVWAGGMAMFAHHLFAPWFDLVDHQRFAALCDRTQTLGMTTIATAHSPLIPDVSVDHAFRLLRELPAGIAPDSTLDSIYRKNYKYLGSRRGERDSDAEGSVR